MASYQSGFDPPNRPDAGSRPKRQGAYLPPSEWGSHLGVSSRMDYRPPDNGNMRTQIPVSRGGTKPYGYQTNVPRSSSRGPSPIPSTAVRSNLLVPLVQRNPVTLTSSTNNPPILQEKRSRNILRRKRSSISDDTKALETGRTRELPDVPTQWPLAASDDTADRQVGLQNEKIEEYAATALPPVAEVSAPIIPELDRYRTGTAQSRDNYNRLGTEMPHRLATYDLPPPTPLSSGLSSQSYFSGFSGQSGYSASPSTRYSESPGPGAYSRDTTPTSMSSQSPGIVAQVRVNPRFHQPSPIKTRPPVTRRRMGSSPDEKDIEVLDAQGLPSLRETLTSSSSNSTVMGSEKAKDRKKKKRLSPLPPSPPPRKSSQKFKVSPAKSDASPPHSSKSPAKPVMTATSEGSPIKQRTAPSLSSTSGAVPSRPRRPSRENTPDLQSQLEEPIAIIQSNLPATQFMSSKRLSYSALPRPSDPTTRRIDTTQPEQQLSSPLQSYSPIPTQDVHRKATPAPAGLGIIPDLRPADRLENSRRSPGLRTPSPSTAAPKSRFGLFGRRTKTTPDLPIEQNMKPTRKGPAAGTGHEGYGKYGLRGRGGGRGSASPSQDSIRNSPGSDKFLVDRMSPRIITGGGTIVDNSYAGPDLARSESSQSLPVRPSIDSKHSGSSRSFLSNEQEKANLWPSPLPRNPALNRSSISLGSKGTAGSGSTENEFFVPTSSLAVRRSLHRGMSNDLDRLQLPRALNVHPGAESLSSLDASLMSDDTRHEGSRSAPLQKSGPKKLSKRPRSPRKWNFFHRPHPTPSPKPQETIVPVTLGPPPEKSIAFYAMMDSSGQEEEEPMDIEDILREAEVVDLSKLETNSQGSRKNVVGSPQQQSMPMTSQIDPPLLSRDDPQDSTPSPNMLPIQSNKESPLEAASGNEQHGRPSRLPQVGRIPRVITARPEQTSPKSFSRPFARFSMSQPPPSLAVVDRNSIAAGPSPNRSPSRSENAVPVVSTKDIGSDQQKDFLVASPRKDSAGTSSSSSGGLSFSSITAVIPEPESALEEDEVWDEYDDLIAREDNVKVPPSATSSHGNPFQYDNFETRRRQESKESPKDSPTVDTPPLRRTGIDRLRLALASSSVYNPEVSARFKDGFNTASPTTPMSFSDFISGYGDRNNSVIVSSGGTRRASSAHSPREPRPASSQSKSASFSETPRQSGESKLMTIVEQIQESPTAQVNLRVGSMTVSKWLTFGHVLFSPVRNEFSQPDEGSKHHSVLVIDGLGNDDWSFYAAETYPTVTIYNLSPTPSRDSTPSQHLSSNSFPQLPPNHRQVQYTSHKEKFPFPRDNFSAVVLRFLPSSPEASMRHLIAESKRVLKPAGYLELSILDLDMMNMGNRARRAVRGLKVQLSVASPEVSLASASDTVLRIIGKRGFRDIKSCRVGVPVASTVSYNTPSQGQGQRQAGSGSSSAAAQSSKTEDPHAQKQNQTQTQAQTQAQEAIIIEEEERSLADMMRDETSAGDAGITKMVAKVGRWWWTRCYEMGVLPAGVDQTSRSIFADETLLKECEKWNTSFKLLVCHAQKPGVLARRRTASV